MAFKGHLGIFYSGTGSLPPSTFHTFLDDIVADVSGAIASGTSNGWSVYDDQRNLSSTMICSWLRCAQPSSINGYTPGIIMTSASQQITCAASVASTLLEELGGFTNFGIQIGSGTLAGGPPVVWYDIIGVATNFSASIAVPYTGTTAAKSVWMQCTGSNTGHRYGYVILKCSASDGMSDLYVQIMRPPSYAEVCYAQAFASWNSATHSGSSPGPMDAIRGYASQHLSSSAVIYALGLFSGALTLWANGYPLTDFNGDLLYYGSIDPTHGPILDPSASVWACTHQVKSAFTAESRSTIVTTNLPTGGATSLIGVGGIVWTRTSQPYTNTIELCPRGKFYLDALSNTQLDKASNFQMVGIDVYNGRQSSFGSDNALRRGGLRYLRYPVSWPSGMHMQRIFPADDGNDYLILRVQYTGYVASQNSTQTGWASLDSGAPVNVAMASGYCLLGTTLSTTESIGEFVFVTSGAAAKRQPRFFCIPTNI